MLTTHIGGMSEQRINLTPTPYHRELVDYLRSQERELWDWFSSAQAKTEYTESLRLALLKTTYRLDADAHPDLVGSADEAKTALGLDFPLTLYQAQQSDQLNASLYYIPGEGHLVLSGPLLATLTPIELKSVLGHELAHYLLWQREGGVFLIADRILQALADDPRSAPPHEQSAQRYRLYTEIFADRGSLAVTNDLNSVVSGLVKVATGLHQVSGASYLKQADEIFAQSKVKTEGLSHPETFIRARALRFWAAHDPSAESLVTAMIEGEATLQHLDLLAQLRLTALTRKIITQLLAPKWFQSEPVLAHARLFFNDFKPVSSIEPGALNTLTFEDPKLREYFAYLLLDFVVADRELEDLPLAAAWEMACKLGIESAFEKLLANELKLKPRDLKRLKQDASETLKQAQSASAPILDQAGSVQ